jgi:hypothetical protein
VASGQGFKLRFLHYQGVRLGPCPSLSFQETFHEKCFALMPKLFNSLILALTSPFQVFKKMIENAKTPTN